MLQRLLLGALIATFSFVIIVFRPFAYFYWTKRQYPSLVSTTYVLLDKSAHLCIVLWLFLLLLLWCRRASRFDYANYLSYSVPQKHTARLQRAQHALARVVTQLRSGFSSTTSTELLKHLHWLPIEWRIRFKLATLTFKALHTAIPRRPFTVSQNSQNHEVHAIRPYFSSQPFAESKLRSQT